EKPQLHMPRSAKGGKRARKARSEQRYWTQISAELGRRLRARCAGRPDSALLLMKPNAPDFVRMLPAASPTLDPWRWSSNDAWRDGVRKVVAKIGEGPETTLYCLRHSSIVRQLLRGVPLQLVALVHDTSPQMIQSHYGKYVDQFGADRVREA